jgi:hypothetical protein
VKRIVLLVSTFFALTFAFWSTADFSRMAPPSEGSLSERLYWASVTALGPLAGVITGGWGFLLFGALFAVVLPLPMIRHGIRHGNLWKARWIGYAGVVLWFFFGFSVAGLRIT